MIRYNHRNMPGPGDEITWPPCTGHPGDPRTDDLFPPEEDESEDLESEYHEDYDLGDDNEDHDIDYDPSDN